MMEDRHSNEHRGERPKEPEARYAYYRRCQVFRKGGEQCKAPAETGSHICHAHAGQLATAVRRARERRAVLEEAVGQMRRRGKPECEMADLFMDFNGIQVTLAVMTQALIDGRVDCKTAGRLVVELQTWSKLLWKLHGRRTSTTETRRHGEQPKAGQNLAANRLSANRLSANQGAETRVAADGSQEERNPVRAERAEVVEIKVAEIAVIGRAERAGIHAEKAHGPPGWPRAA
jgi:hypothetical protein